MKKIYLIQHNVTNSLIFENRVKLLGSWIKYFGSNWLVETELTATQIYEKLAVDFEKNSIFIIEINKTNYYGRMDTKLWDWLKTKK